MTSDKPIIGITLDWEKEGTFSPRPHFALREHYFKAVHNAGGLPIAIPHLAADIKEYLRTIDGIIIPGGGFAFPEDWYVDVNEPEPYKPSPRLEADIAAIKLVFEADKPLLDILQPI